MIVAMHTLVLLLLLCAAVIAGVALVWVSYEIIIALFDARNL